MRLRKQEGGGNFFFLPPTENLYRENIGKESNFGLILITKESKDER